MTSGSNATTAPGLDGQRSFELAQPVKTAAATVNKALAQRINNS